MLYGELCECAVQLTLLVLQPMGLIDNTQLPRWVMNEEKQGACMGMGRAVGTCTQLSIIQLHMVGYNCNHNNATY